MNWDEIRKLAFLAGALVAGAYLLLFGPIILIETIGHLKGK